MGQDYMRFFKPEDIIIAMRLFRHQLTNYENPFILRLKNTVITKEMEATSGRTRGYLAELLQNVCFTIHFGQKAFLGELFNRNEMYWLASYCFFQDNLDTEGYPHCFVEEQFYEMKHAGDDRLAESIFEEKIADFKKSYIDQGGSHAGI